MQHPDIEALKANDEDAFRNLIELYGKAVFNLCLNIVANAEEAEDQAQETFIEAWNSIGSFRQDSEIKTWLYRIAMNKCYDFLRRMKRKKRFSVMQPLLNRDEEPIELPSNFQHPGITLENKESAQALFAALETLPDNQQSAFVLYEMEGMDYRQIAQTLDVSVSSVEALLFRARKELRKKLEIFYTPRASFKKK
ncbi:MAG: RNA polymerase sigma factor [Bacteroidia bacterium]|jgi:RNA polymerase sigma-70 factor (ECF subfamily)|nr:RNA polymerase sigma factor [Bacteroidia bacterium]